jgi:hypothetical protein
MGSLSSACFISETTEQVWVKFGVEMYIKIGRANLIHIGRESHMINVGSKALPWLRRLVTGLSPRRTGFAPGSVCVGFVVGKVVLGQVFLRVLLFYSVRIILPWLSILIYHLGMNNRPVSGRSSETSSHFINMNVNNDMKPKSNVRSFSSFPCKGWSLKERVVLHIVKRRSH